jgi:hypothetical protein
MHCCESDLRRSFRVRLFWREEGTAAHSDVGLYGALRDLPGRGRRLPGVGGLEPMTKIEEWHQATEDHALICCGPWVPWVRGDRAECENCAAGVSIFPAAKAKLGPRVHVICWGCFAALRRMGSEIQFGGRITNNVLPEGLR